ncbi:TOBE domain-containing protein [Planctomycetales bacterium ZRK34]|nr:TOBE domain-containing protein [Planctomycetales bacterium ZRK34]
MKLSASNKLCGKVTELKVGSVNTVVKIQLSKQPIVTAVITNDSAEELGLAVGGEATAVIKASNIMVGICNEGAAGCGCEHHH